MFITCNSYYGMFNKRNLKAFLKCRTNTGILCECCPSYTKKQFYRVKGTLQHGTKIGVNAQWHADTIIFSSNAPIGPVFLLLVALLRHFKTCCSCLQFVLFQTKLFFLYCPTLISQSKFFCTHNTSFMFGSSEVYSRNKKGSHSAQLIILFVF